MRLGRHTRIKTVDCAEIRQGFLTGGIPSGASVDAHLKVCPQCAELFRNGAALGRRLALAAVTATRSSVASLAATEALLEQEHGLRAFLRSRRTSVRWALLLAVPTLLLLREAARHRVSWHTLSTSRFAIGLFLLAVLVWLTHSALRPPPLERRAARSLSTLAMMAWCVPCLLLFAPETRALHVEDLSTDWGSWSRGSLSCFAYGSALAAPSVVLLWALDRETVMSFRVWALAAGMVALAANLILLLHCTNTHPGHLLAGHLSIGLVWFGCVSLAAWWTHRVA